MFLGEGRCEVFDERSGGEDVSVLEVTKGLGGQVLWWDFEGWARDVRQYTMKSEETWIRPSRPLYHHLR